MQINTPIARGIFLPAALLLAMGSCATSAQSQPTSAKNANLSGASNPILGETDPATQVQLLPLSSPKKQRHSTPPTCSGGERKPVAATKHWSASGKPVAGAHRFALLINLLAAAALLLSKIRHADRWAAWVNEVEQSRTFHPGNLLSLPALAPNWDLSLLIPCAAAIALLSGLALYLTTEKR